MQNDDHQIDIEQAFEEGTLVDEAVRAAGEYALHQHQIAGLPMPAWKDGKVIWVSPFDGSEVPPPEPVSNGHPRS